MAIPHYGSGMSLPDYLASGLDIVLVGLNPSLPSARLGHYFASPVNRFWKALNASGLVPEENLTTQEDHRLPEHGIGLTSLVDRPTRGVSQLRAADFRAGARLLKGKLLRFQPGIVCFQGITVYRHYLRYAEGSEESFCLGLQARAIGASRVFVVPNPSPANAAFSLRELVHWYAELKKLRDRLKCHG